MRKIISLLSLGSLVLFLNGCEGTPSPEQAQPPQSKKLKIEPKPAVATPAAVSPPPPPSRLIASTDPTQRRQAAKKGRVNPFALLPVTPLITTKTSAEGGKNVPLGTNLGTPASGKGTNGNPSLPAKQATAQSPKVTYIEVPSPPIPNEARGVFVSGVLNIGSSLVAIVQAPNEPFSVQVTPGTFLANGLVRVKSIDNFSKIPSVTLEQYGMEVVRSVGQAPEPPLPQPPPKRIPIVNKSVPVKTTSALFSPLNSFKLN